MRTFWLALGFFFTGLAFLGIPLPLLPTVPFLLLAAFCFARSSERFHDWLVNHPVFGPPIRDWRANGAISRRGKRLATLSVFVAFGISLALGVAAWVLAMQAAALSGMMIFIWTRPEAPRVETAPPQSDLSR